MPETFLSMGQPFWDYWLPHMFAARGLPIYSIEYPTAFHLHHPVQWSWQAWQHCAQEFARVRVELHGEPSLEKATAMSIRIREQFDRQKQCIKRQAPNIQQWVQSTFAFAEPKLFLELGAHQGTDTAWLAKLPNVTIHAFEPDPRNQPPAFGNVTVHRAAIADRVGEGAFIMSLHGWGQAWTHSSSIKKPKRHLERYPVTFGAPIQVPLVTLDHFCEQQGLGAIDFIWADIQGAEGEMIRGGFQTLARTHYLYTEYSDDELYENQISLSEMLELLPDFRVVELWHDDVLLENKRFPLR